MHLTNQAVQKQNKEEFKKGKEDTVWTLERLSEYMCSPGTSPLARIFRHISVPRCTPYALTASSLSLMGSSASVSSCGTYVLQKPVMRLKPLYVWMGMMPGRMGTSMPISRQSATNLKKTSTS